MAEENNTPADHGKTLASWKFPEFIKPERTASWYVLAFIVTIALLAFHSSHKAIYSAQSLSSLVQYII